ncbi:MAG: UDP-N-acetyl glucosamine 2-epimerase, partial [Rhodospirillales bacterium]|nr:UDP-N-acetyl glucosamine 2-epimerase [Rhodospirillales bacterium]
ETFEILQAVTQRIAVVWPIHPRTRAMIGTHRFTERFAGLSNLTMIDPLGYIDFMKLVKESRVVLTDSGGIQEETTILGVPCLTLRENTERPEAIACGVARLVGHSGERLSEMLEEANREDSWMRQVKQVTNPFGSGDSAQRIADAIECALNLPLDAKQEKVAVNELTS